MAKDTTIQSSNKSKRFKGFFINNQNKPRPILVLIAISLFAIIGAKILFQAFAAGESMSLTTTATQPINIGSNFDVTVQEGSGTTPIGAVQVDLTYDQTKLQYISMTPLAPFATFAGTQTGGSGAVSFNAGTTPAVTGNQPMVRVTFKALATGSTTVSFASTSQLIRATDPGVNVLSITTPSTYTIADTTAPGIPTALTAGTRTVTTIPFTWTAPTDNVAVTGYNVYRSSSLTGTYTKITASPIATASYTNTGLTPNTAYFYKVTALDAANNESAQSSALSTSTLPDTTAPGIPTALTAGTRTVTTIPFTWTAPTDNVAVTGYNVYRSSSLTGTYTKITASPIATASYTNTGLTPNTAYFYKVTALDAANNESAQSSALSTSTLADTSAPTIPAGLTSPSQNTTSISLSWNASTDDVGVAGYNVYRSSTSGGTYTKVNTSAITSPSYSDTGLVQATTYFYKVTALDAANNESGQTGALSVTTTFKPGDVDGNGAVNGADWTILFSHLGQSVPINTLGDLDGNSTVNVFDINLLMLYWGT